MIVFLILIPVLLCSLCIYYLPNMTLKIGSLLTIFSILAGFYLSLLLSVNSKISSINTNLVKNVVQKEYQLRYISFSEDFSNIITLGLFIFLVVIILECLSLLPISVEKIPTEIIEPIKKLLTFVKHLGVYYFLISLYRTISILYQFIKHDFEEKKNSINEINFDQDDE